MKTKFFNAVKPGSQIGRGTTGELMDWLATYINVLFPDNRIERWSDHRFSSCNGLKRSDLLPTRNNGGQSDIAKTVVFVNSGTCEGYVIEVAFLLTNAVLQRVAYIKTFGTSDESWQIAHAISEVIESLVNYQEIPLMVDFAMQLPKDSDWIRETSLRERINVTATPSTLLVIADSGTVFQHEDWSAAGVNAKFHVEAYLKDWSTVLTNMQATFSVTKCNDIHIVEPDLLGYVISDRGIPDATGFYVLPPGGNPLDDRDYIGFFTTQEAAIDAARTHKTRTMAEAVA